MDVQLNSRTHLWNPFFSFWAVFSTVGSKACKKCLNAPQNFHKNSIWVPKIAKFETYLRSFEKKLHKGLPENGRGQITFAQSTKR